jgi:hypothetical protein
MKGYAAKSWMEALAYTAGFLRGWVGTLSSPKWSSRPRRPTRKLLGSGALIGRIGGLASLRRSIVGYNKREVAETLGPPPAAAMGVGGATPLAQQQSPQFWNADTWYYPFDPTRRSAVAVQFRRGRVNAVDFIAQVARS